MRELFSDVHGRLSSKRVAGFLTLVFAMMITTYVVIKDRDTGILLYPWGTASTLFSVGVVEKKAKG